MFNSFFTTFKFSQIPFLSLHPSRPISFNPTVMAKTRGIRPLHHLGLQHSNRPTCPRRQPTPHCIYCQPLSAGAMTSGVLDSSQALSSGDVRSSPMPGGVPAKATGQYTLVFSWEWVLYEPCMVGSRPEGRCTVTLHDVVDEHFF